MQEALWRRTVWQPPRLLPPIQRPQRRTLAWMFTEWATRGKPTALGAASGAVAGLVSITPAAGFVSPLASIIIGIGGGVLCYTACNFKTKCGYDDSLDVVGVHGVGGTWGALATGLFASKAINPPVTMDFFSVIRVNYGFNLSVLLPLSFCSCWDHDYPRHIEGDDGTGVSEEDERVGLDLSQHNERAYS